MEIQKICHNLLKMLISHCAFCPLLWEAGSKRLNMNVFGDVFSFQKGGSHDQMPNNWNCAATLPLRLSDEILLVFCLQWFSLPSFIIFSPDLHLQNVLTLAMWELYPCVSFTHFHMIHSRSPQKLRVSCESKIQAGSLPTFSYLLT